MATLAPLVWSIYQKLYVEKRETVALGLPPGATPKDVDGALHG